MLTRHELAPLLVDVFEADLQGVHLQGIRDHVHLGLIGPSGLGHPKTTEGTRWGFIGIDGQGVDFHMGNLIRAGRRVARFHRHSWPDLRIGAGIE